MSIRLCDLLFMILCCRGKDWKGEGWSLGERKEEERGGGGGGGGKKTKEEDVAAWRVGSEIGIRERKSRRTSRFWWFPGRATTSARTVSYTPPTPQTILPLQTYVVAVSLKKKHTTSAPKTMTSERYKRQRTTINTPNRRLASAFTR